MDQDYKNAKESEIYIRIKNELEMISIQQRLKNIIPPQIHQIFELKQSN